MIGEFVRMEKELDPKISEIGAILSRYYQYQIQKLDRNKDDEIKFVRETSDVGRIAKKLQQQAEKELKKLYPDGTKKNIISVFYDNTEETQKDIDKIIEDRDEAIKEINNRITDVKALINLADSYYEKMEILKNYGIVDSEGKIKSW